MSISNNINTYRNFQNAPNRYQTNTTTQNEQDMQKLAAIRQKTNSPEKTKDEGKTADNTRIPPPNGLGSIFDIKA